MVAGLTDYQVEHLYLRPQAEAVRREQGRPSPAPPPPDGPPAFPDRETYVGFTGQTFGWSPAKAGAEWDRMKAEWDRQQRGEA